MPSLKWNELDFLEFVSGEITVEQGVSYGCELRRDGLRLLFTVWINESAIQASLFRNGNDNELFTFAAYVRGQVRFIDDQRGKYMEIEDAIVAPNRFWYIEAGDVFDRERFQVSVTITVSVDPDIRIAFVNYESRT